MLQRLRERECLDTTPVESGIIVRAENKHPSENKISVQVIVRRWLAASREEESEAEVVLDVEVADGAEQRAVVAEGSHEERRQAPGARVAVVGYLRDASGQHSSGSGRRTSPSPVRVRVRTRREECHESLPVLREGLEATDEVQPWK